ncbi:hypothetical protein [Paenibacillus caui]|uniref:hypothetical protein n=1 Tax=Paenibacillus caui TaxID=2873927 RepID=UPI001CA9E5A5|nr:hypothetical protein [Paenibacillus caui]
MDWFRDYEQDLKLAFSHAESIVADLAPPFNVQALQFLKRFNILEREMPSNYICFLLPFWMEDAAPVERNVTRMIATANILGMMSFHLQDEAMDNPDADLKQTLALSNLLHAEFTLLYGTLFPVSSPLWVYYKQYLAEWAIAVSQENNRDWFQDDPVRMGHKAALVKLASSGILLLSDREALIPGLSDAVDYVLVVLQMLDDWEDWHKDLEEGSYNSLISIVQSTLHIPDHRRPTCDEIREGLYTYGVLSHYALRAQQWEEPVKSVQGLVPRLYDFYDFLLKDLVTGSEQIETERKMLESGGLQYILSKI